MTQEQKSKYILFPMLIIGVVTLITLAVLKGFYGIDLGIWQYVIVPFWIGLFGITYICNKKNTTKKETKD